MPSYHKICKDILGLDKSIRLVILFSKNGDIVAVEYRNAKELLMSPQEICVWIIKSLLQTNILQTLEQKLGKVIYTFTEFTNVKTIVIELRGCVNDISLHDCFMLVSLDRDSNHNKIIDEQLFPLLRKCTSDDKASSQLSV